jgi:hypothetical protein
MTYLKDDENGCYYFVIGDVVYFAPQNKDGSMYPGEISPVYADKEDLTEAIENAKLKRLVLEKGQTI